MDNIMFTIFSGSLLILGASIIASVCGIRRRKKGKKEEFMGIEKSRKETQEEVERLIVKIEKDKKKFKEDKDRRKKEIRRDKIIHCEAYLFPVGGEENRVNEQDYYTLKEKGICRYENQGGHKVHFYFSEVKEVYGSHWVIENFKKKKMLYMGTNFFCIHRDTEEIKTIREWVMDYDNDSDKLFIALDSRELLPDGFSLYKKRGNKMNDKK